MKDKIRSMRTNDVWDLVEIPKGANTMGYRWVYKTKRDSKGISKGSKVRLIVKGFTQREGIDHNETFSANFTKDSFRTIDSTHGSL